MKINTLKEDKLESQQETHAGPPAAGKFGSKVQILLLLLISGAVFFTSAFVTNQLTEPTGDEPHYLVISQTLWNYHSLEVTRDYAHGDYQSFFRGRLLPFQHTSPNKWGELLPLHSIGAPVLWLLPFALAGRLGVLLFMSVVSILIVVNVYWLLLSLGIHQRYALFTALAIALASPVWLFSHHYFVEPVAALLSIYIVRVLFQKHLGALDLLGSSVALGILPWIHVRFALSEMVLCAFLFARLSPEYRFTKIRSYLAAFLPMIGLFLIFEAYNFFVWGSLNPAINQANSNEVPFDAPILRGLAGLFFDQESGLLTNFPIFLFLLAGILLSFEKRLLRFNILLLLLAGSYIVTTASFHNWDGAISPPARFMTILVPLFAFYLALVLQKARSWIVNGLFLLFTGVAMLYEGLSLPGGWIKRENGQSPPLAQIGQALHLPLTRGVPAFFPYPGKNALLPPGQGIPLIGWLVLCGGLTLLVVLLARRAAPHSRAWTSSATLGS